VPTETHTGRLSFGDGEVAMEDGTVLAVQGSPTPCATAAGRFAIWGETQPVTVTGNTGTVDNSPVLYVTNIQWAAAPAQASAPAATADFSGSVTNIEDAAMASPPPKAAAAKTAKKQARNRSSK